MFKEKNHMTFFISPCKKRNYSNSKLLPTKKGDGDSVYKRGTRNIQPSKLGDHKKAGGERSESKIDLMSNRRILRPREVHMQAHHDTVCNGMYYPFLLFWKILNEIFEKIDKILIV